MVPCANCSAALYLDTSNRCGCLRAMSRQPASIEFDVLAHEGGVCTNQLNWLGESHMHYAYTCEHGESSSQTNK